MNDFISDRVQHELRNGMDVGLPHELAAVRFHGKHTYV
jgi:hypothetical protein